MLSELLELLGTKNQTVHKFDPEIKVKRETDTLYISEVRKTKVNYLATIEVYKSQGSNDKAPIPLGALDNKSLNQIMLRLQ